MKLLSSACFALVFSLFAPLAQALPTTAVTWTTPSGTTDGKSVVELWMRLSVAADAIGPLVLDGSATSFSAIDMGPVVTPIMVSGFGWSQCSGSFVPGDCNNAAHPWRFDYNYDPVGSFFGHLDRFNRTLQPGESLDILFGRFTPQNGPVAPGTYTFKLAGIGLSLQGLDAKGDYNYASLKLGDAGSDGVDFVRVVEVPEPGTLLMLGVGLGLLGARLRRR